MTNAFHSCPQQQLIKFMLESGSKSLISKYIFPIKTQLVYMLLFTITLTSQNLPLTLNSLLLSAMAFYEHLFALSLVLALSLSSTDTSLAARQLLDIGADSSSTPALIQSTIPPLIQPQFPNVGLPVFQTVPKPKMPATLPSTQIPLHQHGQ